MDAERSFVSTNDVDKNLPQVRKKAFLWIMLLTVTACLVILAAVLFSVPGKTDFVYNANVDPADVAIGYPQNSFQEPLSQEQLNWIAPKPTEKWMEYDGNVVFLEDKQIYVINLHIATSTPEEQVFVSIGRQIPSCVGHPDTEVIETRCGDVTYVLYETIEGSDLILGAETMIGEVLTAFRYKTSPGNEIQAKKDFESVLTCFGGDRLKEADVEKIRPRFYDQMIDETLTHEQALMDESFGAYFTKEKPEGFEETLIRRYRNAYHNRLTGRWASGDGYLSWEVSFFYEEDLSRLVSPEEEEKYSKRYYKNEGELPEEYQESYDSPVFKAEELTLEAILNRMEDWAVQEFSVKYDDCIVTVRAKGVEAYWLYQQLKELQ